MALNNRTATAPRLMAETLELLSQVESRQTVNLHASTLLPLARLGAWGLCHNTTQHEGKGGTVRAAHHTTPQTGETRADRILAIADDTAPP